MCPKPTNTGMNLTHIHMLTRTTAALTKMYSNTSTDPHPHPLVTPSTPTHLRSMTHTATMEYAINVPMLIIFTKASKLKSIAIKPEGENTDGKKKILIMVQANQCV